MKKLLAFGLCVVLLLGIAVPAFAADTAAVDYCGVNIVVDGARLCPKDADGKPVEPFILNGTTYLPVRAVANALGLEVGWEPGTVKLTSGAERTAAIGQPIESTRTRTITIGGQDTKVTLDGKELDLKDAAGNPVTPIISDGVTYLPVRAVADALEVPVLWDGETATVYLGKAIEWKKAKVTYWDGSTDTYTYDEQGRTINRKTVWNKDDWDETTYVYDAEGNCIQMTETRGYYGTTNTVTSEYTYDSRGNLLTGDGDTYTYDAAGRLATESRPHWQKTYSYDEAGRCVKTETMDWENKYTEIYEYDGDGNIILGRFYAVEDGVESYSEGRCIYDDRGNGIYGEYFYDDGSSEGESKQFDQWDHAIRTEYFRKENGSIVEQYISDCEFTYDDGGNIIKRTDDSGTTVYSYDAYGNLIKSERRGSVTTYEYTPIYH